MPKINNKKKNNKKKKNNNCLLALLIRKLTNYELDVVDIIKYHMKLKQFQTKKELENAVISWQFHKSDVLRCYGHISYWDVSKITDMSYLFQEMDIDEDISRWDISNVNNMEGMFYGSTIKKRPKWDTIYICYINMHGMYYKAPHIIKPWFHYNNGTVPTIIVNREKELEHAE